VRIDLSHFIFIEQDFLGAQSEGDVEKSIFVGDNFMGGLSVILIDP
jgi:hypothetical protein